MENKIFSDQQIALEEFVGVAHGAIEYVGAANYIERQHEAHEAVSKAANKFAADLAALRARLAELVCPECDSRIMDNGYCMLGHWCGKPLK
jgi:hypothetical protein